MGNDLIWCELFFNSVNLEVVMTQLTVVSDNSSMVLYNRMCKAIVECHRIDEIKDIRDKAIALEKYSQQAKNKENERMAREIRLRAERKCGEISAELPVDSGGGDRKSLRYRSPRSGGSDIETKSTILERNGINSRRASEWERSAKIPEKEFEEKLKDPKVSSRKLADYAKSKEPPKKPKYKSRWPDLDARLDLYDGLQRMVEGLKKVNLGLRVKDRALEEMSELNMELPLQIRNKIAQIKLEMGKLAPLWLSICPCPFKNPRTMLEAKETINA
jgi:hypothetical protein